MSEEPRALSSRRDFLGRAAALTLLSTFAPALAHAQKEQNAEEIGDEVLARAEELAGVEFTTEERELMRSSVQEHLDGFAALRDMAMPNATPPALSFRPFAPGVDEIYANPRLKDAANWERPYRALRYAGSGKPSMAAPTKEEELLFAPVSHLAEWLRRRKITSTQLTKLALERLRKLDPSLHFVINFTEERALEQAAIADEEIGHNRWRGTLHGIPWGAKDLLAVEGYPTTWGAAPYRDQSFDETAEVVKRLDAAGAVLVAKTSVGALAWGDVWFGGTTRNPWNVEQGSSGSSAGSASTVAAGALPFALGTETLGSIVSPCTRCGATGLRPTFGRVPRTGCMALTWSMDKIGPIARRAADAAFVLEAIAGADGADRDAVSARLDWKSAGDPRRFRFGYHASAFEADSPQKDADAAVLDVLRGLGMKLEPIELPELPVGEMLVMLEVEAASAFDELTRSNRDDELTRQIEEAWPNVFRAAQLVPAVQYVHAMRAREQLVRAFDESLGDLDGYVTPSFRGGSLSMTNLTGHPAVVMPNGFREEGTPTSISFVGRNYGEGPLVAVAAAYQEATDWHLKRPSL
jgi:Asp-tRNA(Asn)/Glu-tRNA(Gln) amidotransferase A subunit family amidase